MAFLVEVLFSLMVIILTYNTISKEAESGTLQLLLSNPLPRHEVLLGKILANALVVAISLACGMILQIAIVGLIGKIPLNKSLFIIVLLLFIFSFIYLLFWIVLSTLFSVVARSSNISLTMLLILWILSILIIPSLGRILDYKTKGKVPTSNQIARMQEQITQDLIFAAADADAGWRGGNLAVNALDNHSNERKLAPIFQRFLRSLNTYQ